MDPIKVLVDKLITHLRPRLKADQRLEPELVADYIDDARLEVIKDTYAKKIIMDGFYQRLRLKISRDVDSISLALESNPLLSASYSIDDPFFIAPIPPAMSALNYSCIKHLGGLNFSQSFDRVTLQQFMNESASEWTENRPKYTVDIDKVYLKKIPDGLKVLEVLVILQKPRNLTGYEWETTPYPMPTDFHSKMLYIAKMNLLEHLSIPIDPANDNIDSTMIRMQKQQNNEPA